MKKKTAAFAPAQPHRRLASHRYQRSGSQRELIIQSPGKALTLPGWGGRRWGNGGVDIKAAKKRREGERKASEEELSDFKLVNDPSIKPQHHQEAPPTTTNPRRSHLRGKHGPRVRETTLTSSQLGWMLTAVRLRLRETARMTMARRREADQSGESWDVKSVC